MENDINIDMQHLNKMKTLIEKINSFCALEVVEDEEMRQYIVGIASISIKLLEDKIKDKLETDEVNKLLKELDILSRNVLNQHLIDTAGKNVIVRSRRA